MICNNLPFPQKWDLQPREATTLQILLQKQMPSFAEIMELLYGPAHKHNNRKVLTVYVSFLRKKLKKHISCFDIKSSFGHGYYIDADVRLEVCAHMPQQVAGRICTDPIIANAVTIPRERKPVHKPRSMSRFRERLFGVGIASNGKGHVLFREETIISEIHNDLADILANDLETAAGDLTNDTITIKMSDVKGNNVIFRCCRSAANDYAARFRRQAHAARELKKEMA